MTTEEKLAIATEALQAIYLERAKHRGEPIPRVLMRVQLRADSALAEIDAQVDPPIGGGASS